MDCALLLQQVLVVSCSIGFFWKLTKHMWSFLNVEKEPIVVLVTEATGPICYAIVPMITRGAIFGPDQPVILHLLDAKATAGALECIRAELIDAAFPLLRGVVATMDTTEACQDIDVAVIIGGVVKSEDTERKEFLSKNIENYKALAMALEEHAAEDCKILVVADPANTIALVLKHYAQSITAENVTYLTRTDHNQALGRISESLGVCTGDVRNVVVWGKRSFVDATHATVTGGGGEQRVRELVADDKWLKTGIATAGQQRGEAVSKTQKLPGALSTASAACDHMRDWILGTPKGTWVSMGVCSDGSYGIQPGLIYSFPVTCEKGQWSIVQGLKIDEFTRAKMDETAKELTEEKSWAYSCL